jgi:glycosyltransferase involved in cell wall biosynthesis
MSEQVGNELRAYTSASAIFSPHPMFENFGERVERTEACHKLGLDADKRYLLFFGLIRDYKGLDLLLEAFEKIEDKDLRLLVAGEFYNDKEQYRAILDRLGDRVVLREGFVKDEDVKYYFSAVDALVLPYRTATQSGVTQIAYNFSVPMVVTRVGGLPEIVADGKVGFVCEPTVEGVYEAITKLYKDNALQHFAEHFPAERKRFSWATMCDKLVEVLGKSK